LLDAAEWASLIKPLFASNTTACQSPRLIFLYRRGTLCRSLSHPPGQSQRQCPLAIR
jgi:hypothetical protein